MEKHKIDNIIPDQRIGSKLDAVYEVRAFSEHDARRVFDMAVDRLLDVNIWDRICGPLSAKFYLTDSTGQLISRKAQPGDHFRIDIPGPGPSAGNGFDWVKVEAMDDRRDASSFQESITLRVRPSPTPWDVSETVAHFLKRDATSSFRVVREGRVVRAEVHGRNEVPNTRTKGIVDKIRNAVVGGGAVAGISKPQWMSLVRGLLEN